MRSQIMEKACTQLCDGAVDTAAKSRTRSTGTLAMYHLPELPGAARSRRAHRLQLQYETEQETPMLRM